MYKRDSTAAARVRTALVINGRGRALRVFCFASSYLGRRSAARLKKRSAEFE